MLSAGLKRAVTKVDVPVPQVVEEIVHVPVTQTQARRVLSRVVDRFVGSFGHQALPCFGLVHHVLQGHHHQHVEQTVEVPVPMTQEEVVHVPKVPHRRFHCAACPIGLGVSKTD